MAITATLVKELREKTGAGMMDCKKALVECDGDMTKAVEYLQKKSLAAVEKRAGKVAAEGAVYSYIHDGRVGAMVEINCETDFVARGDDFQEMLKNVAMHIAASNPLYLDPSEIPAEVTAKQVEIYTAQLLAEGKPEAMIEKIMTGKLNKWHKDVCLLNQDYVKDDKLSVDQYVKEVASGIKENIRVRRFVRFELGEGIEKKEEDFAAEVAAAAAGFA
jgi:elongation factor Ts